MSVDKSDVTYEFIARLLELTQDKELTWSSVGSIDGVTAFGATLDNRRLRVRKIAHDEYHKANQPIWSTAPPNYMHVPPPLKLGTSHRPVLELLDSKTGDVIYTFSGTYGLDDLYEAASFAAGKVDEFIASVLKKS
jgi:hypothetical protein